MFKDYNKTLLIYTMCVIVGIWLSSLDNKETKIVIEVTHKYSEPIDEPLTDVLDIETLKESERKMAEITERERLRKLEEKKRIEKQKADEKKRLERKKQDALNKKVYMLAQIIYAEAKGEPYNGKIAVGNVILNRVKSEQFPDTIRGVIFQNGQFSPVSDGSIYNQPNETSLRAAKEVLNGKKVVGSDALYFYNPRTATDGWIFSRPTITQIGNHRFAM